MRDFISSETFRFLWMPILTIILVIIGKRYSKPRYRRSIEDLAVGLNLVVTAIFIFITRMGIYAEEIERGSGSLDSLFDMFGLVIILIVGYFGIFLLIKSCGWCESGEIPRIRNWNGVIWPDLIGVTLLIIAYVW